MFRAFAADAIPAKVKAPSSTVTEAAASRSDFLRSLRSFAAILLFAHELSRRT